MTRPLAIPDDLAAELAAAYGEPHRAYHDLRHVDELLAWFDVVAREVGWVQPAEVQVAILFHDVVYDVTRADNEARSAARAREAIARAWPAVDADRVAQLIELTAQHGALTSADGDAALFLDCDLAILGAAPARYDEYERAIAIEYARVAADAYRAGRRAFLARLAAKPRLYFSDFFHARLDATARANLARALAAA